MNKFFVLVGVVIALVVSIANIYAQSPGVLINGFKFFDPATQAMFLKALDKDQILFEVSPDGTVIYSPKDEERVSKIRFMILENTYMPGYRFEDLLLEKRFLDALDLEKIKYFVEYRKGARWIFWSSGDDGRVDEIRRFIIRHRQSGYK